MIGERSPGVGKIWRQCHRASQGRQRRIPLARLCQRQPEFVLRRAPSRLVPGERFQCRYGTGRIITQAARCAGDEHRLRMVGADLENLCGLLRREHRLRLQQAQRMPERRLQ